MTKSLLQKLTLQYHRASCELEKERDRLFPVGCKVMNKILGIECRVIGGSLYPDQVNTSMGHCSPTSLQRIDEGVDV